jgi:hypothetical protein
MIKKFLFCLIAVALIALAVSPVSAKENSLKKGAWAIQFEIDDDFQPRSFKGSMLSIKKHYSRKSAWRLGVSMMINVDDLSRTNQSVSMGRTRKSADQIDSDDFSLDLTFQYLYYPSPRKQMNVFFGIGPHIGYLFSRDDRIDYDIMYDTLIIYGESRNLYEYKSDKFVFGAAASMGVEWFFMKSASLMAEYGANLDFEFSSYDRKSETTDLDENHDRFRLFSTGVKFGLSVYF